MPSALAMGTSSGVSNNIADNGSRKQPTISSRTLTTSRNCQGVTSRYLIHETSVAGTWLTVRSQANTPAQATMTRICAVKRTVATAASMTSATDSSRKITIVTKAAYTHATAAASVGEKMPP